MSRKRIFLAVMALFLLGSVWVAQAVDYESYSGFVTSEAPVLPDQEVHPSLWFGKNGAAAIYAKREADQFSRERWRMINGQIDYYKKLPFPKAPVATDGKSIQRYYGDMSRAVRYLAFGWQMTGDTVARDKAIEALLRMFDGPIYELDPKISSIPNDEIYQAVWVQNYCSAYDWVYDQLTPEQNQEIRRRFKKQGQWMHANLDDWGPRPHNHRSKPAWALGTLALTLSDEPQAKEWLAHALKSANTNTKYFFSADGIYREGSHYLIYSMVNLIPFLYHYKNVSGVDNFPAYQPAFDWMLLVRNGRGWLPNIEDAYLKPTPLHMVAKEYMKVDTALNPQAKLGNLYQWSYFHSDLTPWGGINGSYSGASIDDTWLLDEYLTYDPAIEQMPPTGDPVVFLDKGGQTVFKNNWNYNDPSTRYLLFQGVAEADNHFHYDHLSFIIQAENQMMASDCGYSSGSYSDPSRKKWYLTGEAHNIVAVNGEHPQDAKENQTPVSRYNLATDFFAFQEKEAVYPATKGLIRRAVAFPGLDYFVVTDRLTLKAGTSELYLHGGRGKMTGENNFRSWEYQADIYGPAARMAAWIFPGKAKFSNSHGQVTYVKGDNQEFGYLTARQESANPLFMQVIIPLGAKEELPKVVETASGGVIGAKVEKGRFVDYYLLQNNSQRAQAEQLTTDATFGWVRTAAGQSTYWMFREATMAQYGTAKLFSSDHPLSLTAGYEGKKLIVNFADGTPEYRVSLSLPETAEVVTAVFNGIAVKYQAAAGEVSLKLSGGGKLELGLK